MPSRLSTQVTLGLFQGTPIGLVYLKIQGMMEGNILEDTLKIKTQILMEIPFRRWPEAPYKVNFHKWMRTMRTVHQKVMATSRSNSQ